MVKMVKMMNKQPWTLQLILSHIWQNMTQVDHFNDFNDPDELWEKES